MLKKRNIQEKQLQVTSKIKRIYKIKQKKALGNIRKIDDTLNERPIGIHTYKAAILLRGGVIVGPLLNNIEAMVNVTKSDFKKLEKRIQCFQKNQFHQQETHPNVSDT